MKKIFGLFMLMLLACNMLAEDMIYPSVTASVLSREGNMFYSDGEKISRRDVQAYLKFNAEQDIYKQFRSGKQMYDAGWSLMGIGFAIDAAFITYSAIGIYYWAKDYNPEQPTMGPAALVFLLPVTVLPALVLFQVPAIPLICVGQKKMKNSFEAYNISLSSTHIQPELRLQANNNGIGLVCNF